MAQGSSTRPSRLIDCKTAPILSIAPHSIGKLDPNDSSSLYSLWTVFSKCAQNLENGRRLENISWRLWNRELLYENETAHHNNQQQQQVLELPEDEVSSSSSDTLQSLDQHSSTNMSSSTDSLQSRKRHKQLSSEQLEHLFNLFKPGQSLEEWKSQSGGGSDVSLPTNTKMSSSTTPATTTTDADFTKSADNNKRNQHAISTPELSQVQKPVEAMMRSTIVDKKSSPSPETNNTHHHQTQNQPPLHLLKQQPQKQQQDQILNQNETNQHYPTSQPQLHRQAQPRQQQATKSATVHSPATALHHQHSHPHPHQHQHQHRPQPSKAASRPSLFQRSTRKRTSPPVVESFKNDDDDESSDFYSDTDDFESTDEDEPDMRLPTPSVRPSLSTQTESTSPSTSQRLAYRHRTDTSTSIVRGFEPGQASVSVVNRSPVIPSTPQVGATVYENGSSSNENRPANSSAASRGKGKETAVKMETVHTKVPREKMFFIESSPSDNEQYGANSMSTDGGGVEEHNDRSASTSPVKQKDISKSPLVDTQPPQQENEDDGGSDSDWDSVDDESDESFEDQVFLRDDKEKRPLMKPSLLSSLFLNNPEKLEQERREQQLRQQGISVGSPLAVQSSMRPSRPTNPTENLVNVTAHTHAPPPTASATSVHAAMSPRTTRRNMIQNELSESLRRNLWIERQRQPQKLQRSHTSVNVFGMGNTIANSGAISSGRESPSSGDNASLPPLPPPLAKRAATTLGTTANSAGPQQPLARRKSLEHLPYEPGSWREDMEDSNMDFNYHARGW